jgi:hypothetical protein
VNDKKRYEILEGLPVYGPMYIPVTKDGKPFYSEGFVVRIFKPDGGSWVGNFAMGWTAYNAVYDYPADDRLVIIAGGQGYIMATTQTGPLAVFGLSIDQSLQTEANTIVAADQFGLMVIGSAGVLWQSPRISWDGIKELTIDKQIVSGFAFDPTHDKDEWVEFRVDLETKHLDGGSYRQYYDDEGNYKKKKS